MDTTLAKGLAALAWIAHQQRGCGVSELADALGIPRSAAHRTLQTLVACGWMVQDKNTSAYRTSLRLFELGSLVAEASDVAEIVRPCLAALARDSGETIHLTALDGAEVVYLSKFDSPLPVAVWSRIGSRAPAYCVASGKALLAAEKLQLPELKTKIGRLIAYTPSTITNFEVLASELERIRAQGYAKNEEGWRVGVCGLGAPVFDARCQAVAAIGMTVPSIRFGRKQARVLAQKLVDCARQASTALGYRLNENRGRLNQISSKGRGTLTKFE